MTCNGGALEFVSGCLGDVMPLTGAANVVIDLAACLTFDGVSLNSLANLALRASSTVTLTDLTNANADATAYSYITLITPTLTILPSLLLTASALVFDGGELHSERRQLQLPRSQTASTWKYRSQTPLPSWRAASTTSQEVYGDPDLNIDLSACVEFNGIPLTAPLQASSVITLTDLTNANANALAYPYFTLTAQTLNVDVDSYWFPVHSERSRSPTKSPASEFPFSTLPPLPSRSRQRQVLLLSAAGCLADISEVYGDPRYCHRYCCLHTLQWSGSKQLHYLQLQ